MSSHPQITRMQASHLQLPGIPFPSSSHSLLCVSHSQVFLSASITIQLAQVTTTSHLDRMAGKISNVSLHPCPLSIVGCPQTAGSSCAHCVLLLMVHRPNQNETSMLPGSWFLVSLTCLQYLQGCCPHSVSIHCALGNSLPTPAFAKEV